MSTTELISDQFTFLTCEDAIDVIRECHRFLDTLSIPKAQGVACNHSDCNSLLGHRIRTLADKMVLWSLVASNADKAMLCAVNQRVQTPANPTKIHKQAADEWMDRPAFVRRGPRGFADDVASEETQEPQDIAIVLDLVAERLSALAEQYRRAAAEMRE